MDEMTTGRLRAVVIGAGHAAEGHVVALRSSDVEVIALCARQPEVASRVARQLEVPASSSDWRSTIAQTQPDILCVATPASLRAEVIEFAVARGLHVLCEKPLASDHHEARRLWKIAKAAGIKHAFASTMRYAPSVRWLRQLVLDGAIGKLRDIHFTLRSSSDPNAPWSWYDSLSSGGGVLNSHFPHMWGVLSVLLGSEPREVHGESRVLRHWAQMDQVRVRTCGPGSGGLGLEERLRCDADNVFSASLRFAPASLESRELVASLMGFNLRGGQWPSSALHINGEFGTLGADFRSSSSQRVWIRLDRDSGHEELPIPEDLLDQIPRLGNGLHSWWAALVRDFVDDIRGLDSHGYPNFRDAWQLQKAIDLIRSETTWHPLH